MFEVTCVFADGRTEKTRTTKDGPEILADLAPPRHSDFPYCGKVIGTVPHATLILLEKPRFVRLQRVEEADA